MAFGADKPFDMKIAYAIFPPSLRFAQAGLATQKVVSARNNYFWDERESLEMNRK